MTTLRAGVWWHASTLRLVSDIGHPVRDDMRGADRRRERGLGRRDMEQKAGARWAARFTPIADCSDVVIVPT